MVKLTCALLGALLLSQRALAEVQCPDWDTICPEDQRLTGLVVLRGDTKQWPCLHIRVPPKSVQAWRQARLYLRHKDQQQGWVEVNMGFMPREDGWSEVNVYLWDKSFDHAELVIYLDFHHREDIGPIAPRLKSCKDTDYVPDFGGFTFTIPAPR